ncbi:MAG: hypothetical protein VYE73_17110 [Acidobacteriota bacterium]|nr:hypothetical protein [Acidobacteriota bacterium]
MKITAVKTTAVHKADAPPFQDATMAQPRNGLGVTIVDLEQNGFAIWWEDPPLPKDGFIAPDDRPGNGLAIDAAMVEKYRVG